MLHKAKADLLEQQIRMQVWGLQYLVINASDGRSKKMQFVHFVKNGGNERFYRLDKMRITESAAKKISDKIGEEISIEVKELNTELTLNEFLRSIEQERQNINNFWADFVKTSKDQYHLEYEYKLHEKINDSWGLITTVYILRDLFDAQGRKKKHKKPDLKEILNCEGCDKEILESDKNRVNVSADKILGLSSNKEQSS